MGALSGCVATVNGCMRDDPVQAAHLFRIVGDSHASRVTFQMFELCVRCVRLIRSPVGGSFSLVAVCRFAGVVIHWGCPYHWLLVAVSNKFQEYR